VEADSSCGELLSASGLLRHFETRQWWQRMRSDVVVAPNEDDSVRESYTRRRA